MKSRLPFLYALSVGSIGAVGQAYLLYHELVNTLPYKATGFGLYQIIANIGIWIAPLIAIIIGWRFGLKRLWLASTVPVMMCPLLFVGIFVAASVFRKWNGAVSNDWNFDGQTPELMAHDFFSYSVSLAIIGLIVGAFGGLLLHRFSKPRKLV